MVLENLMIAKVDTLVTIEIRGATYLRERGAARRGQWAKARAFGQLEPIPVVHRQIVYDVPAGVVSGYKYKRIGQRLHKDGIAI